MKRALIVLTTFFLVTVSASALLLQACSNSFHESGRWITSKTYLERGVIGGVMFRVSRVALARDRVDFGSWFGFHEILWRDPVELKEVEFDFALAPGAWLGVLSGRGNDEFDVIRLSRYAPRPSGVGVVDRERRFVTFEQIESPPPVADDGWHTGRLEFESGVWRLLVDGKLLIERSCGMRGARRFGFKSGGASVLLDNVVVHDRSGGKVMEDFANHRGRDMAAVACAAGLAGLHGVLALALWIGRSRWRRPRIIYHLALAALCASVASLTFAADRYWWSSRYPANVLETPDYPNTITFDSPPVPQPARLDAIRAPYRILIIGSSQAWGSGATFTSETWGRRLESRLNAMFGSSRRYEVVNTAISGATSSTLWPRYRDEWIETKPNMTIIALGHNDTDVVEFGLNLGRMTELGRTHGVVTVFLLEPNSRERSTFSESRVTLPKNHLMMRRLGDEFQIPYFDMQARMDARRDEGFLWWDLVHMTSTGHAVFAEELAEALPQWIE